MAKSKSARGFNIDLSNFNIQTQKQATQIFKKITLDLDQAVVLDTPVDTGRARGNWFPSINAPSTENNRDKRRYSQKGVSVINRVREKLGSTKLGDTFWLTNNTEYILKLENGMPGGSKQAPRGMVDKNVQMIQAKFGGDIRR